MNQQTQEWPLAPAFLSPAWPLGAAANGIVPYVDGVAAGLRRLGHSPCILSVATEGGPWPDVYPVSPQERSLLSRLLDPLAFRISPQRALLRRYSGELVAAVQRVIAERKLDLLEMEETFGLAKLVKARLIIPIVVRLHGPHFATGPVTRQAMNVGFRQRVRDEGEGIARADAVSAPSRHVLERTRAQYGFPLSEAVVIPPPAPIVPVQDRWTAGDCDHSRILFVGRFDRIKGGDVVIDCFRILLRTFPDVRLWLVGSDDGVVADDGRHWNVADYVAARAPEAAPRIEYLGRQPNSRMPTLRRKAMLTVVGSRYDFSPLTVLEAMSYGCPLVATRVGGIPELLRHEVNSLLCRAGNAEDMAAMMGRLLANADWAGGLGRQAAKEAVQHYHHDAIARQSADFYRCTLTRASHLTSPTG